MHLLQMCSKKGLWHWLNNWSVPQDPRGNALEMRIPGRSIFSVDFVRLGRCSLLIPICDSGLLPSQGCRKPVAKLNLKQK